MRSLYVEDISYILPSDTSKHALPTALVFNVDTSFNKYTDIAKLIKETVGYDALHYSFTETTDTFDYPPVANTVRNDIHA